MTLNPVPIAVTEDAHGLVVSLPPRFWLLVSLRRLFPRMLAEARAWTYRLPATVGAGKRVEIWIAEVALQFRADERRRAWTASDAEWAGAVEPAPAPGPVPVEPIVVVPPGERTGPAVLALLRDLSEGAVMTATVEADGVRRYHLEPSGRAVRATVAERAIRERLIVPGRDGLLGPESSQTWRGPTAAESASAAKRARKAKPATKPTVSARRTRRPPRGGGGTRAVGRRATRRPSPVAPEEIRT